MLNSRLTLPLVSGLLSALISTTVTAHGWVDFPNARQSICYEDGGIWSAGGVDIPNAACKGAFDMSGPTMFVQRNELAALVPDYNNMAAVQAAVPDGTLCSANGAGKDGLNIVSGDWQTTLVETDANNEFEMRFRATAPHSPSFWQFYISKPSYDPSATALTWDDLELVDTFGDPTNVDGYYYINVAIPAERSGNAVLFTRWQRADPAGEGFYNCSDINIVHNNGGGSNPGEEITPPETGNGGLSDLAQYINPAFETAELGDSVRFRLLDGNGSDLVDETIVIDANNLATAAWAQALAAKVNDLYSDQVVVGIWHDSMNHYMFDAVNLYDNRVWSVDADSSVVVSLIKAVDPVDPVDPPVTPPAAGSCGCTPCAPVGDASQSMPLPILPLILVMAFVWRSRSSIRHFLKSK